MGQTLVIAPNESLFTYAGIQGEEKEHQIQQGALALSLNWSEEQESQSNAAGFIKSVVNAAAPNLNIAIKQTGEDISKAQSITALLVSPEAYVVALFASRPVKEAELSNALENWNSYFKALQQHQYLLGEQFSIKLLSNSVLSNEQQALAQTVRCALKGNIDSNEILQQFEGFSVDDNTESWAKVVHFSLQQYQSLISAKNENAKKDLLLNAAKNEKEGIEKALKEQHEEVKLNKQKIQVLQGELETKETEAKKNQAAIAELTQQNRDINSELAQASGENKALVAESNKQKSENELLVLQIQQLQEELEAVFTDAENSKVTIADLEVKYTDINRKLAEANSETQFLIKENKVNADENALLQLQIQQLQEELEVTFSKLTQVQQQLENAEQTNTQLKAATKEKQPDPEVVNTLKEKLLAAEDENALLVLQISQLQEELESIYVQFEEHKNTSAGLINKLEAKLSNSEGNGPALRKELENAMSEQELLQLQIKQLQEELEFYFTEYQKLKGESPDNKALSEFKSKIEERFPHLVLSEGVTLTGGANQKDLQRITARFTQVEHADKHWNAFSVIVNDRKGVLDVEFHAPDNKRVYPLSKFVKTGSNKVCDFSLLSPFTDAGKKALAELSAEDHLLLIGIVEELQTKLQQSDVQRTDATANIDIAPWPEKLLKLSTALRKLTPSPAPKPLNFKKLSLKQNMVGATNEHLLICIENLQANGTSYPAFDIKVGAKQIKDKVFTEYGSLEFRELANNQAPLASWPPAIEDKWGLKLVLDLPAQLNEQQQNAIDSLKEEDKLFIKELLTKLADRLHTLDRKKLKVNQPLENWQKLISGMVAKF
ncbi:hypothetical protein BZA03_10911 [Alteromonas sp. I10]|uniref:hypothetical protein n=1 Tax=Alteromonas TaxID=226 RepID=UPI000C49C555|nr:MULTISPECIES: hypothetical protein [Alteromonas]MBE91108.1 hypothetical protein [Rhodospirillaceae bacterium]MCZ4239990.1 hypothetical protein [Alteromonas macleodii]PXW71085.1 hypothetical protein BZA03_10911 [Alteromonas sp. I10]